MRLFTGVSVLLTSLCFSAVVYGEGLSQEDQIRKAVFEYQFEHNASGQKDRTQVYCLSLSLAGEADKDPSDAVMAEFNGHELPVRKVSECYHSEQGVFDRGTGKQGLIFFITRLEFDNRQATVTGGYYEGGMSGSLSTYRLEKWEGKWRVTNDQLDMIS